MIPPVRYRFVLARIKLARFGLSLGLWLACASILNACGLAHPTNPSFNTSLRDARTALNDMAANPVPAQRPIVAAAGWYGTALPDTPNFRLLRAAVQPTPVVVVTFEDCENFSQCRTTMLTRLADALGLGPDDPLPEVDVIGISMGGLVAMDAVAPPRSVDDPRRLNVHTLYGISVPHRGLKLGSLARVDGFIADMERYSDLQNRLRSTYRPGEFHIESYARLGDLWVDAHNTAPPGGTLRWLPNAPFSEAHLGMGDPRIAADIARRLRGELPLATDPPAPLP